MGWMMVVGSCVNCGWLFTFNPDLVPSVRVIRVEGRWVPDAQGKREPVCQPCVEEANRVRSQRGMPTFAVPPGAYEAQECA